MHKTPAKAPILRSVLDLNLPLLRFLSMRKASVCLFLYLALVVSVPLAPLLLAGTETLTELRMIEESLCKSLIALFHARIKYPEERPLEKAS